ncbi:MAG: T9SS type A sorting domain-containing protein [Candidatus Zixiibacteriota bacterium]|nr:MAG: T9SS type A sorting domain-containing protein [candidate division Zixibacteria bacterium]
MTIRTVCFVFPAALALLSSVRAQTVPEWSFSILASVKDTTVARLGGPENVTRLIREQFDSVNVRFNRPGVFDGTFNFSVDSVHIFQSDPYTQSRQPHPDHDYQIVYDCSSWTRANWLFPPDNGVLLLFPVTSDSLGPFGYKAGQILTHELAHARGAVDLYGLAVSADLNEVNGVWFSTGPSIMKIYMDSVWDQHSINIINRWADHVLELEQFRLSRYFPSTIGLRLTNVYGGAPPRARVTAYAHGWYDFALSDVPVATGRTDSAGVFRFLSNPFAPDASDPDIRNAWDIKNSVLLIEIRAGSDAHYYWLPFTLPQNAYFSDSTSPYFLQITIPPTSDDLYQSVPDYFTLYQNVPNPFNSATEVYFELEQSGHVLIEIYNILGRRQSVPFDGWLESGMHHVTWEPGRSASGVYLARVTVDGRSASCKMLMLK